MNSFYCVTLPVMIVLLEMIHLAVCLKVKIYADHIGNRSGIIFRIKA